MRAGVKKRENNRRSEILILVLFYSTYGIYRIYNRGHFGKSGSGRIGDQSENRFGARI